MSCYLQQILVEGFYHADPHPGNLLVRNDGVLILLDFGMVGQVSIKKALSEIIAVPDKLNRFIDGVESGDIRFYPARGFEQRLLEHNSYLANQIVKAVLASGLVISGSQLLDSFYVLGVAMQKPLADNLSSQRR